MHTTHKYSIQTRQLWRNSIYYIACVKVIIAVLPHRTKKSQYCRVCVYVQVYLCVRVHACVRVYMLNVCGCVRDKSRLTKRQFLATLAITPLMKSNFLPCQCLSWNKQTNKQTDKQTNKEEDNGKHCTTDKNMAYAITRAWKCQNMHLESLDLTWSQRKRTGYW